MPTSGTNAPSRPLVFFGNERLATGIKTNAPVLRSLLEHGYAVAAVVSNYERGNSRDVRDLEIAAVAKDHGIPLLLPDKLSDIREQLIGMRPVAGVLVAYGKIVPESIINIFPRGIINLHPSLLPLHRGSTPLESVILDASTRTGVSLMGLAKAMDAGAVYAQSEITLTGTETKQELADNLIEVGQAMLIELLPGILAGEVVSKPQDDTAATYDNLITKEASVIDFTKPAVQLEREVRAFADWPKSRTTIAGKEVVITKAQVVAGDGKPGTIWRDGKQFGFYTTDDILQIIFLKPAGKPEMSAQSFLNGYGNLLS